MENYSKFREEFTISDYSRVRKHKQIINSVLSATIMGSLKLNDKLPSVNELSIDYNISRDTVVRAYAFLKENNIIDSVPGKGYYVKSVNNENKTKVFLLFNELTPFLKKIYDVFAQALQDKVIIDFYMYQNNYNQFKKHILCSNFNEYTHCLIAANFDKEGGDFIDFVKNEVPVEKLILLTPEREQLVSGSTCLFNDFETDIFLALSELDSLLKKYVSVKLIFPNTGSLPKEVKEGFFNFCNAYNYDFGIIEDLKKEKIEKHTVYVDFVNDESLVKLIKKINETNLVIGKDVGIVSYDDNPLKELLLGGITVISNVFEKTGNRAANMILKRDIEPAIAPFKVKIRNSL